MSTLIQEFPWLLAIFLTVSFVLKAALNNFTNYIRIVLVYFVLAGSKITLEFTQESVNILGLNVYFSDLIIVINLILLLLTKSNRAKKTEPFLSSIWPLLILTFLGILFWSLELGLKPGWNNWRIFTLSFTLFLVARRNSITIGQNQIRAALLTPFILDLLLTYIYIFEYGLGTAEDNNLSTELGLGRPITASGALVIMYTFFYYLNSSKFSLPVIIILTISLISLILVQHRSVWLATLGGIFSWVLGNKKNSTHFSRFFSLSIFVLFTLATYLSVNQLQVSTRSTNTLQWRITRWEDSFRVARSILQWALGAVFGPTAVQLQEGSEFKVFAHNAYVATIESFGFVGFFLLIIFLFSRLTASFKNESSVNSNMYLISALIFGFFYWIEPSYWLILGFYSAPKLTKPTR